jgi:precorrin-6B methylase 2
MNFEFAAPIKILHRAQVRGIESIICRLIIDRCKPGDVCIDVGASYGFITVIMGCCVRPKGSVLSFEPDSDAFRALEMNVQLNTLSGICTPIQAFVGSASKSVSNIRIVTIDEIVGQMNIPRVDFIKIDVDGAEADVLRGAMRTIARWQPIVVIEMNAEHEFIVDTLESNGYVCADMHGNPVQRGHWPPNVIAGKELLSVPPRGFFTKATKRG